MASLPHTPPSSTSASSYKQLGPVLVEPSRDARARFANREDTPPPSAVHHSLHPGRDIVTGSGSPDHPPRAQAPSKWRTLEKVDDHPQGGQAPSNRQASEEVEQLPPGAFPIEEEESNTYSGEGVKNAVDAIRDYAKTRLPAAFGINVGVTKEEDQREKRGSPATPGEGSTVLPEEREPPVEGLSRSTGADGASHNTNPFRGPEFMQTHGSRMRMTSTEVYPTPTRPRGYTDEPSAWTSPYADTSVPPIRTYDVVRDPSADQSQDVSSGFGGSLGTASLAEPVTTARAVPFMAEPPLVVYPNPSTSSAPTRNETGQNEARPSGEAPTVPSVYEDQEEGASSLGTPIISDQEQNVIRNESTERNGIKESQSETKHQSKGLLSKLNKLFLGKSAKSSKEQPPAKPSSSSQRESDTGRAPATAEGVGPGGEVAAPDTRSRDTTPPSDTLSSISQKSAGTRPVRIAAAPRVEKAHSQSTHFRRHPHLDVIPKNVPAHFEETIGPLPRHVTMRGKRELPTKEKPSGSRVGVGSLPGRRDEVGVARLPDERNAAPQNRAYDERHRESVTGIGVGTSTSQGPQQPSSMLDNPSPTSISFNGAEQVPESRSRFFSELLSDAEEILRDIGDVAWYYVPGIGNSSGSLERQPIPISQEPEEQSSPSLSPSPVAAATPTLEPPSSPVIGIPGDARQAGIEGPQAGCDLPSSVGPTSTIPSSARPFSTQLLASAQSGSDPLATPMDPSSHPSRSSSAEEVGNEVFVVGPPSTRERISGKQEYIAAQVRREYVTSPEDQATVGAAGSLPWYPTEAGLRALIGERMYDDQMREAGAAEPEETTISVLTNPLEVPGEKSTAPSENRPVHSPPPVAAPGKGLDVTSLGTRV